MVDMVLSFDHRVGIVTVPEMHLGQPLGGAEAIAEDVALGLSSEMDVVVFHGYSEGHIPRRAPRQLSKNIWACDAFELIHEIREHGIVSTDNLDDWALTELLACDVVVEFERVVSGLPVGRRILVVGGIAYQHCEDCMRSVEWDVLVVPSDFVARFATKVCGISANRMQVIPNGVDVSCFMPGNPGNGGLELPENILLVPGRPDDGKGFNEAIDLAMKCRAYEHEVKILTLNQESFLDVGDFYERLLDCANGVRFEMRPWVPRSEMPSLYQSAATTLCLGTVPEGFGLVAAESLACGTPVLARNIGALTNLVPEHHGLAFIEMDKIDSLAKGLPLVLTQLQRDVAQRGVEYVHEKYGLERMIERYRLLVAARLGHLQSTTRSSNA